MLAAIFSSSNTADITVKGDYAGGIVGKADYGIIVAAENYGDILTDGGNMPEELPEDATIPFVTVMY